MTAPAPGRVEPLVIRGPAGSLEALLSRPRADLVGTAVVCHPNPLEQGTMHHKVVFTLARAFERAGILALRFNFRGVGESEGHYGGGVGEAEDAVAVGEWLRTQWPDLPLYAAGFSFGALVAIVLTRSLATRALVTVAPPAARMAKARVAPPECPWLVIQGDQDTVTPLAELEAWLEANGARPKCRIVTGAGHFFHGQLAEITAETDSFLAGVGEQVYEPC